MTNAHELDTMHPTITISDKAAEALRNAIDESGEVVHLTISPSFEHALEIGPAISGNPLTQISGVAISLDPESSLQAEGIHIDFVEHPGSSGFRIDNPNAPAKITEVAAPDLKELLESGVIELLVDVRTTWEREIAKLSSSLLLDEQASATIAGLDRATPIAFYCHHGIRSRAAASHFLSLGFTKLYNLDGGIEAWSQLVDASIPRY